MLTPRVVAIWYDKKYTDYYYGVRPDEVMAGRPAYGGEAGTNAQLGVRAMYRLDAAQSVLFDVSATSLGKGITNSPLVNRTSESRVTVGYLYRF
jgi:outer membrane protein